MVLVGREEEHFVVHKSILCARSKFFKAACSAQWVEGKEKIVRLRTMRPKPFQMYLDWAYSNSLANVESSMASLLALYIVGDFLDDIRLRNKTMDLVVACIRNRPKTSDAKLFEILWNNTPPTSLLRSWIVDVIVKYYSLTSHAEDLAELPPGCVLQVTLRLMPKDPVLHDPTFMTKSLDYLEVEEFD